MLLLVFDTGGYVAHQAVQAVQAVQPVHLVFTILAHTAAANFGPGTTNSIYIRLTLFFTGLQGGKLCLLHH